MKLKTCNKIIEVLDWIGIASSVAATAFFALNGNLHATTWALAAGFFALNSHWRFERVLQLEEILLENGILAETESEENTERQEWRGKTDDRKDISNNRKND